MYSQLQIYNLVKKSAVILLILVLVMISGSVMGAGHEGYDFPIMRSYETPDMILASLEAEGTAVAAPVRVESADMVLARHAIEEGRMAVAVRVESPDMVLARHAIEEGRMAVAARVESPDMVLARVDRERAIIAAERPGIAAAPVTDTAVSGINIWLVAMAGLLVVGLIWYLVGRKRVVAGEEKGDKYSAEDCSLAGANC